MLAEAVKNCIRPHEPKHSQPRPGSVDQPGNWVSSPESVCRELSLSADVPDVWCLLVCEWICSVLIHGERSP